MYDFHAYPYPSKRFVKFSARGMCATSHHLAAQAGLDTMKRGGNAFDAAIAAAACLTVLEPQSNGVGGDAFALIWSKGKLYGLNASGFSGSNMTLDAVLARGDKIPVLGFSAVTTPGAPGAWAAVNKRFGRLALREVVAPAVDYAESGQAVSHSLSTTISTFGTLLARQSGEEFRPWFDTFMPEQAIPQPGQLFRNPALAKTLAEIGETQAESFYRGALAQNIADFSAKHSGFITEDDLASYEPEWVDPVSVSYRGYDVWEIPPNGQGIVALMALNILKGFEPAGRDDVLGLHRELEAIKLAFADGHAFISDAKHMRTPLSVLLSDAYAEERRRNIGDRAAMPMPGKPNGSGTVYLCAADGEGNMISYIQSNYRGFGSGLVVPGTGIALQNRGLGFSLDPASDNCVAPRKRPYHTIIPGFLTKDGQAVGPFGVMGGYMQPQGHVQVVRNLVDRGMNPQACLDAPRWQWIEGKRVELEYGYAEHLLEGLKARGHEMSFEANRNSFGRGQMILQIGKETLMGGTDPRCEGECAAW